jgi:hypothetical protein
MYLKKTTISFLGRKSAFGGAFFRHRQRPTSGQISIKTGYGDLDG